MPRQSPAVVRAASPLDAAAIAAIYAPYVSDSVASFEDTPPDGDEIARRMSAPPRLPWLVAQRSGETVGYCYGSRHRARPGYRWSVECSVYLADHERGQGTAQALYGPLLEQLRTLGYVTTFAGITLPNPASVRFHESMGFESIGVFGNVGFKHGGWHDVGWWQRALRERPASPPEPTPWEA